MDVKILSLGLIMFFLEILVGGFVLLQRKLLWDINQILIVFCFILFNLFALFLFCWGALKR